MSTTQGKVTAVVVFDLDGTLADTQADIAGAMNHVLGRAGLPLHPVPAYRRFVGDGVDAMVERAAGGAEGIDLDALKQAFRERYVDHLLDETKAYAGATAMLHRLTEEGFSLAVLSNKPDAMAATIVGQLFEPGRFVAVRGARPGVPKKPDPTALLEMLAALEMPPQCCAMVGDSVADMGCGVAAGALPVAVTWGFRGRDELQAAGAKHLVDEPGDLPDLLTGVFGEQ